jgi:uncharacterized protein YbbC (DUF1343 family)
MRLGCERLFDAEYQVLWTGKRIGLITNYTGIDRQFRRTVDRMIEHGAKVMRLFTAEHGFYGVAQAGVHIASETDRRTGIEIISLYGEEKSISAQNLTDIDLLIFEFQDVGVRFYTYISTMFRVMKKASELGIPLLILDRPNPIGGISVEGPGIVNHYLSFVGEYNIPIRHGLTLGELSLLYKDETGLSLDVTILPVEGWSREQQFPDTGLQWVPPSPNMPTFSTAQVYPGTAFFEGTNLSEGRGTTLPFQWIGAPWIDGERLADRLNTLQHPGVVFRPVAFSPTFSKYQGERVEGVHVHILNDRQFRPTYLGLKMISEIMRIYPDHFKWTDPFKGRYFIDLIWGSPKYREDLEKGRQAEEIDQEWQEEAAVFEKRRSKYLLYR